MRHTFSACGEFVELCPLERVDVESMRLLRNKNKECFVFSGEITPEEQQTWYLSYLEKQGDYVFSVFYQGCWIGAAAIYNVKNDSAEFGRLLVDHDSAGRSGLGVDITKAACAIGFEKLGLSKIYLEVYEDNLAAIKTYERTGFLECGYASDHRGRRMINMIKRKEVSNMTIQVLKPKFEINECLSQIQECLEKGWTGMGFKTVEFEEEWKKYSGHQYAHYINSDTVGLHLAVKILKLQNGWQDGDEIITTPITFVSTPHSILYENMRVVFADVDDYLCLDPEDVERKITEKTRAIMFVGYGGRVGQLEKIIALCKKRNLKLILDAAHMVGTRVNGVTPGTWEGVDVSVYSYQAVKNLPTGDSGMICFANEGNDNLCRKMAWLGINKDTYSRTDDKGTYKWKYDVDYVGYKYHGNSIMAAIGLVQLKYLDRDNIRRREIVARYTKAFKDNPNIQIIDAPHADECSYHIYEIVVPDREALLAELARHGIYGGVHYRDNTEYSMYRYAQGTCPYAHEVSQHLMTLPLHMWLNDEDVEFIIKTVNDFFG